MTPAPVAAERHTQDARKGVDQVATRRRRFLPCF